MMFLVSYSKQLLYEVSRIIRQRMQYVMSTVHLTNKTVIKLCVKSHVDIQ